MTGLAELLDAWEAALRRETAVKCQLTRWEEEFFQARAAVRAARDAVLEWVPPQPGGLVVDEATGLVTRLGGAS